MPAVIGGVGSGLRYIVAGTRFFKALIRACSLPGQLIHILPAPQEGLANVMHARLGAVVRVFHVVEHLDAPLGGPHIWFMRWDPPDPAAARR